MTAPSPCANWESGRTFWLQCRNCGFDRAAHESAGEMQISGGLFRADKIAIGKPLEYKLHAGPFANKIQIPKEKEMVAFNQRETTTKAHEYVLALPAAAGDVQEAMSHAIADKRAAGYPVGFMDAVMVRTVNDEELIVYWEEEVK